MPWIKKNLALVVGGLLGLALLAGSGYFLYSELSREDGINSQLEGRKADWTRLNNLDPYPDDKNIKATKEESARVEKLANHMREGIHPIDVSSVKDTYSLRLLIETTISELRQEAEDAGVRLPDKYAFTFQRLREMGGEFNSNGIPKLAEQVSEVGILCRVLYRAKIHSLDTLRRSPVLKEEGGTSDYLTKKSVTNQWVIRTPYDLSFRGFSAELAETIRGLAALKECIAIKTVNIEPTTLPQSSAPIPAMPPPMMPPGAGPGPYSGGGFGPPGMDPALRARYGLGPSMDARGEGGGGSGGMDPALRARYGLGPGGPGGGMDAATRSRYGMGPAQSYAAPTALSATPQPPSPGMAPSRGPAVVIDEKPLRVILQLDFIKPKPSAPVPAAAHPPRAPVPAPTPGAGGAPAPPGAEATSPPAE